MKRRLRRFLYGPPRRRRNPNAELDYFEYQLGAANSSPFAAYLSFSDDVAAIGLGIDWGGFVDNVEAEGSRLVGAKPCGFLHAFESHGEVVAVSPCPSCKAAV